jgi:protein O-GlcNAc transferase
MPTPGQANLQRVFESAIAEHRAGRVREASRQYAEVLRVDPEHEQALFLVAALALESGRPEEAQGILQRLITRYPQNPVYWVNFGEALRRQGRLEPAAEAFARAVTLKPDLSHAHFNLGIVTQQLGELALALPAFERAADLKPDDAQVQRGLANALVASRSFLRALGHFQCALALAPKAAPLWVDYAVCLRNAGRCSTALAAASRAVELDAQNALAHHERSAALTELGRFDEAIASSRNALGLQPRSAAAHTGLAAALVDSGQLEAGIAAYRAAVELDAQNHLAHSNLLFLLAFAPGNSAQVLLEEARRWQRLHAPAPAEPINAHANERDPERRLRLGYVSSNFNDHCQSLFTLPVLEQHDHARFELFAYASLTKEDSVTAELRERFDVWRDISTLSPLAAAELIRRDEVDVLVDLTMHMSVSQLRTFAHKPAPVQIAWLAYPGTTGLEAIDYRITDIHLDPPELPPQPYAERSLIMPETFWCYRPGRNTPEVAPLPASARGYVTFGCLNSFWKLNDATLELWARVLGAVAESRLLLLAPEGEARARVRAVLKRCGVDERRLEFASRRPRADYLRLYDGIDICLDTLPYNGHTTSLDAFYMGAPVVTLVGDTVVGRAGLCQAQNLGLPELIADAPDSFVAVAAALARDVPGLAQLRATLRDRMSTSPLMDARRFTRDLEQQYREAFRRWCAPPPG